MFLAKLVDMKQRYSLLTILLVFLTSSIFAQSFFEVAIDDIKRSGEYEAADLADIIVTDEYQTRHNGLTHIYLKQRFEGIEIDDSNVNYNISEDAQIISSGGQFVKDLNQRVSTKTPAMAVTQALQMVLVKLGIENNSPLHIIENVGGKDRKVVFDKGDFALEDIPARLKYILGNDEKLKLSWEFSIYEKNAENYWVIALDASNGEVLKKDNLVLHCSFEKGFNFTNKNSFKKKESIISIKQNAALVNDSYMVYAFPVESPNHGNRTLQISPWTVAGDAGTLGWHDDGTTVSNFTKGNNVDAYEDTDANNQPTGDDDARVDGGNNHEFDFPLDLDANPLTQQDPIITNLFYWNNIVHDVIYQYGFDEPSGNFQEDNLGRGGSGSDYVYAEAQDGSGSNNANFSTNVDGINPRMQMYLWDNPGGDFLEVNAPGNVIGDYVMALASFGGDLNVAVTGDVVEVDDGSGSPSLGCDPLINGGAINGNIALIDRGTCEFGTKCLHAQNAGAIAVIVCNNEPGNPITMGGGDDGWQVTIPAVMIRQDDCVTIRAELGNGLNATMVDADSPDLDSDLDNGVIVHEYTHGISNRLTGGPNVVGCLNNAEQMGEGWSDFFALWMTTNGSDIHSDPRGMGTYLLGEPLDGDGIRPTPYSTSFSINPSTYGDIHNNGLISQPHGIGYLWCTMIWDLNWALINAYGYNGDLYDSGNSAGNNVAMQLVIDGLKMQECDPGFEDGRDAILDADLVNNGGANATIIWNVFARRGMGYSADQGSRNSRNDGSEAFDLPPGVPFMTEAELFDLAPLPVELTAFKAVADDKEKQINLFWNTASEANNKGFEILRRTDARNDFETIGWVDGIGESFSFQNYEFNDLNVKPGMRYYYQLKQIDLDGEASFSDIVTASLSGLNNEIEVYPNPTNDVSFVKISDSISGKIIIEIFDSKGQLIDRQYVSTIRGAELEIDFSQQPEGVYFLQLEMENQSIAKRIVVKR